MYCKACNYGSDTCRMKRCPQCGGEKFSEKPEYAHGKKAKPKERDHEHEH